VLIEAASGPHKRRGFGEGSARMAEGSEKQETSVYVDSTTGSPPFDSQRPGTAHLVLEQFEGHGVSDRKIIERGALAHVAAMEKDFAIVRQADEPVALADEQADNPPRARRPTVLVRSGGPGLASRRHLSDGASRVLAHVATSAVPNVDAENRRRRTRRYWFSDGPR